MDSVHQSQLVLDESAWLQQPSVYPGSRLPPLPSKPSRGMGRVEVYPPVVERGASVKVRSRCAPVFHPPMWRVSFRALAVVLDSGKMAERELAPEKVIEHRRVSSDFMCGRPAEFEAWFKVSESVKQEVEVNFEPLKWIEGADQIQRAELLVCLVMENSVMGKTAWTLAGYAPITVLKETPGKDAFFKYAAKVDKMALVWMHSFKGVLPEAVGMKAVEEVAEWRRETWEEVDKQMRDSFPTSLRVQFRKRRTQPDVSDLAQLCSGVWRSAGGFPVIIGSSFKNSIFAEFDGKTVPPVEELMSFISERARELWESLTSTARYLDLNCLKASLHAGPPIRIDGPVRKGTNKIEVEDHGLQPMDEITVGDDFDGLNRVVKLGSIITQFEVKEPGRGGERVRYQALGPVCPAMSATDGKTFTFIETVELELYQEEVREDKMQALMKRLLKKYKCKWRADPNWQKCTLLWLYRTNQGVYAQVNKALCTNDLRSLEEYAPFIWYFRELFKPSPEGRQLHKDLNFVVSKGKRLRRRLKLTEEDLAMYKVRQKVCWPSFTSMVFEEKGQEEIQERGAVFRLQLTIQLDTKKDDCYLPVSIGPRSVFGSHFGTEVLLPPHCMLRVHNVKDLGPGCAKTCNDDAAPGVVNWIIELELDEAPCVWEFIETDRWDDFQQYADDFPEKMDTRHCKASLINAVAKRVGMKATNLSGVDPLQVCISHGASPNEVDRNTGNSPLITLACALLASCSALSPDEVPGVIQGIASLVESGANPQFRPGGGKSFEDMLPEHLHIAESHIAERHRPEYKQLQDAVKAQPFRASDLKDALKLAEASELSEVNLAEARGRLAQEERRDGARKGLQAAIESRDCKDLTNAIADGEACGLPEDELLPARHILVEEERKALERRKRAEKQLKRAMRERDVQMLKQAIDAGKAAAASQVLLDEAEGVLHKQLEREAARKRFKEAVASRDVSQLRAFLQEAKLRGWDKEDPDSIQSAQELLDELEQQANPREDLPTATRAQSDEPALQEALKGAEASGVEKRELAEGRQALEPEAKRTAAEDGLRPASDSHDGATFQAAISQGEPAGLSGNDFSGAQEAFVVSENQSLAKQERPDDIKSRDPEELKEGMESRQDAVLSDKEVAGASCIQKEPQIAKLPSLDKVDKEGSGSLQSAQELPGELEQQANPREDLPTATRAQSDEPALQEALKGAEASGVEKKELAEGRQALEPETKRTAAEDELRPASDFHDGATFQAGISQGEPACSSQQENHTGEDKDDLQDVANGQSQQGVVKISTEEERSEKALDSLLAKLMSVLGEATSASERARKKSEEAMTLLTKAEDRLSQFEQRSQAQQGLMKEFLVFKDLLTQAAFKGVKDAVKPLCSPAFVDKAATSHHPASEVFMQLMDATTPEQAAELGRRLQAEMINVPESFEIFENDEHESSAVESVAATVKNLQKACDQNYESPDGLTSIAEELTNDNCIDQHLPSHVIDIARRWSIDAAIHARGGRTFVAGAIKPAWESKPEAEERDGQQAQECGRFFRATLKWQNIKRPTDLDMHMICPECKKEVYFGKKQCRCAGKSWHLQLDLDDQGYRENSEENIWLDNISDNYDHVYELKVKLYAGCPVPFTILFRREGHPDHIYNFQPHKPDDDKLTIFTWKPSGELVISPGRVLFDLSPLPSRPSHTDHRAYLTPALPEMKTFAEDVDLSSAASLVRFLLDDRVDVKLIKGQYLMELQCEGKTWLRRQEVPSHGFVTREEVEGWTPAHGNCKIISVSHVWETREHPDPLGFQRDQVLKILDEKGFQASNCWFFIDFMSLFQFRRLEQLQEDCFRLSMQHMHVFYAHDYTWTLVVDELTPPKLLQEAEEKDVTVWYDPERVLKSVPLKELVHNRVPYLDRGWCIGETNWTSMRSKPKRIPDMTKDGYCRAPMCPDVFEERQANMKFTHRSDVEVVLKVHEKVFNLKSQATKLVLERLPEGEVDVLNSSLPYFHQLQSLLLTCCNINHSALERLISNLSPSLQQLHLRRCDPALEDLQGKFVVQQLASRFPTLKRLDLGRNKLGDATAQALGDLLSSGWPLKTLNLKGNYVGDAGAQRLAKVIAMHPAIHMNLEKNKLGETGKDAIRDALITVLRRGENPNVQPYDLLTEARAAVAS